MRKLALVAFLLTNLGGVAMAAPIQEVSHPMPTFTAPMRQSEPIPMPTPTPRIEPPIAVRQAPRPAARLQARRGGARTAVLACDTWQQLPLASAAFARVPQLDRTDLYFPIAGDASTLTDGGTIDPLLVRGFEQVLNEESARQNRTVDALLARGAVLGKQDGDGRAAVVHFDLDTELRIVREAYLLRTQPTRG